MKTISETLDRSKKNVARRISRIASVLVAFRPGTSQIAFAQPHGSRHRERTGTLAIFRLTETGSRSRKRCLAEAAFGFIWPQTAPGGKCSG